MANSQIRHHHGKTRRELLYAIQMFSNHGGNQPTGALT
jgi:hypothetical protein